MTTSELMQIYDIFHYAVFAAAFILYLFWFKDGKSRYIKGESSEENTIFDDITRGECPDCNKQTTFYEGPTGGISTNIVCENGHWFNITPCINHAERIKRENEIQLHKNKVLS